MDYLIEVKQLQLRGNHGVLPEEEALGQFFLINLELKATRPSRFSDEIGEVVNYAEVVEKVKAVFYSRNFKLLETLAQAILDELRELPRLNAAKIRIAKPSPPIPDLLDEVAVTLEQVY